jgi:hypothetical protein
MMSSVSRILVISAASGFSGGKLLYETADRDVA